MTRDEILNMPAGKEMDALIASEVMGYDWRYIDAYPYRHRWISESGDTFDIEELEFSSDIAMAWRVVEKMSEEWCFNVSTGHDFRKYPGLSFGCKLDSKEFISTHFALAETAPLAICRAALLLDKERP